jgi:hypothetical protein
MAQSINAPSCFDQTGGIIGRVWGVGDRFFWKSDKVLKRSRIIFSRADSIPQNQAQHRRERSGTVYFSAAEAANCLMQVMKSKLSPILPAAADRKKQMLAGQTRRQGLKDATMTGESGWSCFALRASQDWVLNPAPFESFAEQSSPS